MGGLVLCAWIAWALFARVGVLATSEAGRVVRAGGTHGIESALDGRLVRVAVELDSKVKVGDVLFELDTADLELERLAQAERALGLTREIENGAAAVAQLELAGADSADADSAGRTAVKLAGEAREVELELARDDAARLERLEGSGIVTESDLARARAAVRLADNALAAARAEGVRVEAEQRLAGSDRRARLFESRRELERAQAELVAAISDRVRLDNAVEQRRVRATVDGRVAELAPLSVGEYVRAGESLGVILSAGKYLVEAGFAPRIALGRVRLDARGSLSLDGFPAAQYGTVSLRVERIAGEAREGRIHVELSVEGPVPAGLSLEHGLPGAVSVEVERVSPATLLLRTVGAALGLQPRPAELR